MYRSEHPKPQFMRESWMNLNGQWQFEFEYSDGGKEKGYYRNDKVYNEVIEVPFVRKVNCHVSSVWIS